MEVGRKSSAEWKEKMSREENKSLENVFGSMFNRVVIKRSQNILGIRKKKEKSPDFKKSVNEESKHNSLPLFENRETNMTLVRDDSFLNKSNNVLSSDQQIRIIYQDENKELKCDKKNESTESNIKKCSSSSKFEGSVRVIDYYSLSHFDKIGTGVYTSVYKCLMEGRKIVALKMCKQVIDQDHFDLYKREVEMAVKISHLPRLVDVYGICIEPRVGIVMAYYKNATLRHVMKDEELTKSKKNWETVFMWIRHILEGIESLHNNLPQIVHKDIKTPNILVDEDFSLKLSDFGLTHFVHSKLSQTDGNIFTPQYYPPEILNSEPYTLKGDIYAFSIVLWEIINWITTGVYASPYSELEVDHPIQFVTRALHGIRPTIPFFCPRIFKEMMEKSWVKKKEDRPTATILLEYLRRAESDYFNGKSGYVVCLEK